MNQDIITVITGTAAITIFALLLWSSLRESRRQQERERRARAERERAQQEYWRDMLRQMGALPGDFGEEEQP